MKMHVMGSRQLFTSESFERVFNSEVFKQKALEACGGYWKQWFTDGVQYEVDEIDTYVYSGVCKYPGDKELVVWVVPVVDEDLRPSVHNAIMAIDYLAPVKWPEAACCADGQDLLVMLYEKIIGPRPCV